MATEALTIHLDPKAVEAYRSASADVRRKMQALLSLWLPALADPGQPDLSRVMDEIGAAARTRGLTPDLLDDILRDR